MLFDRYYAAQAALFAAGPGAGAAPGAADALARAATLARFAAFLTPVRTFADHTRLH